MGYKLTMSVNMRELIRLKRSHQELPPDEIHSLVTGVLTGDVPDYQLTALLMAICYEGLSENETLALTSAFVESGEQLTWPGLGAAVVDKHSTGGVGDKVSIALVPWLAAAGLVVPKMSGRGLGHTGGTIDKLEAVPGFRVNLDSTELKRILDEVGCAVVAQSANLTPADKHFYALRDATQTVDELGLIAASVMSKKIAAGAKYIVLDVKTGSGAFFKDEARAREFAALAIKLGAAFDRQVACVLSNMDQPLGIAVGNASEVLEALDLLDSEVGAYPDLYELCLILGAVLLELAGEASSLDEGRARMAEVHRSGKTAAQFRGWIAAQGGDLDQLNELVKQHSYRRQVDVYPLNTGFITDMDTEAIGALAQSMGAGRQQRGDHIDTSVGIMCEAKIGAAVDQSQPLARLLASPNDARTDAELAKAYLGCITIGAKMVEPAAIVLDVITA